MSGKVSGSLGEVVVVVVVVVHLPSSRGRSHICMSRNQKRTTEEEEAPLSSGGHPSLAHGVSGKSTLNVFVYDQI